MENDNLQNQLRNKRRLVPHLVYRMWPALDEWWWFGKQARLLKRGLPTNRSPEDVFAKLETSSLTSLQKRNEIVPLLEMLRRENATVICEIGSYDGGTLFLFAGVAPEDAQIFSLDLHLGFGRRSAFRRMLRRGQSLQYIEGDSHDLGTKSRLEKLLAGKRLDFLFIDGDHSFAGVAADFELYSPLVRPGGLIAFHDIIPDFRTRFGKVTASNGGEVWRFWRQLREKYSDCREFLHEGSDQDGYGIGVLRYPGLKSS